MRRALRPGSVERRMTGRQLASARRLPHDAAALRIVNADYDPFSALLF